MEKKDLFQAVQDGLSRNKITVIQGCIDTKGFNLIKEELWNIHRSTRQTPRYAAPLIIRG